MRGGSASAARFALALALLAAACSRNPVLGAWELDRGATPRGAVLAVQAADLASLSLRADAIVAEDVEIPVEWTVEGRVARAARGDGRGEHRVELLDDGRLRVELPIGVTAFYRRTGS